MKKIIYAKVKKEDVENLRVLAASANIKMKDQKDEETDILWSSNPFTPFISPIFAILTFIFVFFMFDSFLLGCFSLAVFVCVYLFLKRLDLKEHGRNETSLTVDDALNIYFHSVEDMIKMQEEVKTIPLDHIKYIVKGYGEQNQAKPTRVQIDALNGSYDDYRNTPNLRNNAAEFLLITKEDGKEEYLNFPLSGVVSCKDSVLDFTPLDEQVQIMKDFLSVDQKNNAKGKEDPWEKEIC